MTENKIKDSSWEEQIKRHFMTGTIMGANAYISKISDSDSVMEAVYKKVYEQNIEEHIHLITNLLADERARIVEIVEGKKKKRQIPLNEKVMDRVYDCDVAAYNQGIDDVLSLLKEELTKKD